MKKGTSLITNEWLEATISNLKREIKEVQKKQEKYDANCNFLGEEILKNVKHINEIEKKLNDVHII